MERSLLKKKDQVWQRGFIAKARAEVAAEWQTLCCEQGEAAALAHVLRRAKEYARDKTFVAQLQHLLYLMAALNHSADHGGLNVHEVTRIAEKAGSILEVNGINPVSSQLAFLYAELHDLQSRNSRRGGNTWLAAWQSQLASYTKKPDSPATPGEQDLLKAEQAVDNGDLRLAHLTCENILHQDGAQDLAARTILCLAATHRLAGEAEIAASLLGTVSFASDHVCRARQAWEKLCLGVQKTEDMAAMLAAVSPRSTAGLQDYALEARLWAYCLRSKRWQEQLPALKAAGKPRGKTTRDKSRILLYQCVAHLGRCYESDAPVAGKMAALGKLLDEAQSGLPVSLALLVALAFTRWLIRVRQHEFAALSFSRYRASSLALSDGASYDVLGLASGVQESIEVAASVASATMPTEPTEELQKSLRTSRLARTVSLSHYGLAMTGVRTRAKLRRMAADTAAADEITRRELEELAQLTVKHLGALKGLLMKAGQWASYVGTEMPSNVRRIMATLQDRARPVAFSLIRENLEASLGGMLGEHFADFSPLPIATGSVGQVHRARLRDGRAVAVKVQFPGIRASVETDIRNLAALKPILRSTMPNFDLERLLTELHVRFVEECDYEREASNQQRFAAQTEAWEDTVVPKVYPELCSPTVLVSEFIEGQRFAEFVASADQAAIDRAGRAIFRGYCRSIVRHKFFNADQHPGNCLFRDGAVVFVDFGCMKELGGEQSEHWNQLVRSVVGQDRQAFDEVMVASGTAAENKLFDFSLAYEILSSKLVGRALYSTPSSFTDADVSDDVRAWLHGNPNLRYMSCPPDWAFAMRGYWGMYAILSQMGAKANWRELLLPILFDDPQLSEIKNSDKKPTGTAAFLPLGIH